METRGNLGPFGRDAHLSGMGPLRCRPWGAGGRTRAVQEALPAWRWAQVPHWHGGQGTSGEVGYPWAGPLRAFLLGPYSEPPTAVLQAAVCPSLAGVSGGATERSNTHSHILPQESQALAQPVPLLRALALEVLLIV